MRLSRHARSSDRCGQIMEMRIVRWPCRQGYAVDVHGVQHGWENHGTVQGMRTRCIHAEGAIWCVPKSTRPAHLEHGRYGRGRRPRTQLRPDHQWSRHTRVGGPQRHELGKTRIAA